MGAVTEITDFDSAPKVSNAVMALCPRLQGHRHASETFHERGGTTARVTNFSLQNKKIGASKARSDVEAPPRFELGNKGFAGLCLTTWLWRHIV